MNVDTIPHMRKATIEDASTIAELEILLFPSNCMNERTISNEIAAGECWLVLDHQKENVWGYCLVRRDGELLDILRLGVVPEHQGQGIATLLLEKAIEAGQPTMLTVKKDNRRALKLYLRHGFRIVGQLASDNGWVMRR